MEVKRIVRKGSQAVHFVDEALEEGHTVQVELDWTRRFDHMQQHSGNYGVPVLPNLLQVLVSAVGTPII